MEIERLLTITELPNEHKPFEEPALDLRFGRHPCRLFNQLRLLSRRTAGVSTGDDEPVVLANVGVMADIVFRSST